MDELKEIGRLTGVSYDRVAHRYHELFGDELDRKPYDRTLLDEFAAHFAPGALIHDVGCGPTGHIGHYLRTRGLHVIGSDVSPRCVELASACHPGMEFLVMDMADLMLEDRSIDGIVSYYSIIHTPKRWVPRMLRELHRVLKAGGKLLLSVKEGREEGYLEEFLGFRTRIYFTEFEQDEVARLLTGSGFEILSLDRRSPLEGEISVPRIFAIARKH